MTPQEFDRKAFVETASEYVEAIFERNGRTPDNTPGYDIAKEQMSSLMCESYDIGYIDAVTQIKAKVRTMCNQRQIMEYLEGIKL